MPTILGELKRHFRDRGWAVRVPRRIQERYLQIGPVVAALSQELGRPLTIPEIAAALGCSSDEVIEAAELGVGAYKVASLDAPVGDEEHASRGELLGAVDGELARVEQRDRVRRLLGTLPARERRILYLRFFEGRTQQAIAAELGISQMHVSRLLRASLGRLGELGEHAGAAAVSRARAVPGAGRCR